LWWDDVRSSNGACRAGSKPIGDADKTLSRQAAKNIASGRIFIQSGEKRILGRCRRSSFEASKPNKVRCRSWAGTCGFRGFQDLDPGASGCQNAYSESAKKGGQHLICAHDEEIGQRSLMGLMFSLIFLEIRIPALSEPAYLLFLLFGGCG
jgi:hypothetical protein